MPLKLTEKDGRLQFEVKAKPRAKRSRIVGIKDDALEVALAAAPVDGAANEELVRFLAKTLDLPQCGVIIVRGATSKTKLVAVETTDRAATLARLVVIP